MVIRCIDAIFMFASYPSAAFLSCERFYALYWPFKHRLLSTKKYRIAIFILWIFTASLSTILTLLLVFSSFESALYVAVAVLLGPAIFICVCYIEIWINLNTTVFSHSIQTKLPEADPSQKPYFLFLYWLYYMLVSLYHLDRSHRFNKDIDTMEVL